MLKRLTIHNYKAYEDFEIEFDSLNLLMGHNGSGKSTIFEVLRKLRDWITFQGDLNTLISLFPPKTKTKWLDSPYQNFGLDMIIDGETYKYVLSIEQTGKPSVPVILRKETLYLDEHVLVEYKNSKSTELIIREGEDVRAKLPFSVWLIVEDVSNKNKNKKVNKFVNKLRLLIIVRLNPFAIKSEGQGETSLLTENGDNFTSWYKYISSNQGIAVEITMKMRELFDGFNSFRFERIGREHHRLEILFGDYWYDFNELSEGQRMLITLYIISLYAIHSKEIYDDDVSYILCIDEPANYVGLIDIQPWIDQVLEACLGDKMQALLISHHPEFINYLASSKGILFSRDDQNSPARIKRVKPNDNLPIAELMARGWLDE